MGRTTQLANPLSEGEEGDTACDGMGRAAWLAGPSVEEARVREKRGRGKVNASEYRRVELGIEDRG